MPTGIEKLAGPTPVYWIGSLRDCNVCHSSFGTTMYDAKTIAGPWGNICRGCFITHGVGLGTGLGQQYERQVDGRWLKTAG